MRLRIVDALRKLNPLNRSEDNSLDVESLLQEANHLSTKGEHNKAQSLLSKLAKHGSMEAEFTLATKYSQSYEETFSTLCACAKKGHQEALLWVGHCFATGQGTEKDMNKAKRVYMTLAERGHPEAQFRVGELYDNGWEVEQDSAKAASWFLKAAESGSMFAQSSIARAYETGRGVGKDYDKAELWYRRALENGDELAEGSLIALEARKLLDAKPHSAK